MTDEFRVPPADRREPSKFEPPPWEVDAFKELERRKAEQETDLELEAAISSVEAEIAEARATHDAAGGVQVVAPEVQAPRVEAPAAQQEAQTPLAGGGIDEAKMLELMSRLREEEPRASDFAVARIVVGSVVIVLGAVLIVVGMAGIVKATQQNGGAVAMTAGTVMLLFGAGFIGGGAWLIYSVLKKRGVL